MRVGSAGLGMIGAALIAVGSYGAGATRYRGGVVEALGLGWITYGHGFALFETLIWIGVIILLTGWVVAGREQIWRRAGDGADGGGADGGGADGGAPGAVAGAPHREAVARLGELNRTLRWWLVPLALSGPLFSRDVYSYLMQGTMMRDGFDPYTEGAAANPNPMLLEVSADWRNTTTPYGPLHLGLSEAITRLVGDNVTLGVVCFRVVSLAGFLAIAWSVPRIAERLGGDPVLAQWLGVLNPLVLLHLVAGMHNEAVMVGLVSLALVAALELRPLPGAFAAAALLGVSVSMKATAVIALPFVVWIALTRRRPMGGAADLLRRSPAIIGLGVALTAVLVAVLAAVTWVTGSTWGWVTEISGNTKVINPLAAPSMVAGVISGVMAWIDDDVTFNAVVEVTRSVSSVLMIVGLVVCWFAFRRTPRRALAGMCAAYGVAVVFNAVTLPWYYASLLTPLGAIRPPRWVVQVTVVATLILCMSFAGGGNTRFYDPSWMIVVTVAAVLATRWLAGGRWQDTMAWRGRHGDGRDAAVDHSAPGPAPAEEWSAEYRAQSPEAEARDDGNLAAAEAPGAR
ncbi:alpha-(1-_6)-mannopyranosyltransferase A [Corynebacterium sp. 335C]